MAGTRQLAAIVCTDIDGYASLIQQDESKAVEFIAIHRKVLHREAANFHGKIIQNIGHDSLSLFASAVEAVQCAIEMQSAFREDSPAPVKIGIHLGDIIFTGEEAIGDGITIARKIKDQSLPGGILISNKIYEEVKNQAGIETRYLKACELDEQDQKVEVYAITNEGIAAPESTQEGGVLVRSDQKSGSGLRYFWEEAKRRNVVRVVSYYAAAAFIILEATSIISDSLNLPNWTMPVIIILLVVVFILLSIISWIYDITPEGIKKTKAARDLEPAKEDPPPVSTANWFVRQKVLRRYLIPLFVLGLLVSFYIFKDSLFENWERVNKEAREHTEKANLYFNNNADPDLIKQELDLALTADPDYNLALYIYARVYTLEGDTLHAKQILNRIVEIDPGYAKAWDLLASYAYWQDSFSLAMGYAILALEADPGYSFAAFNLAIQSEDRGLYDQAISYYNRTTEIDSTFIAAYSALGALYNKMGRPTEAIFTLRRSLRISPASIYNYMVYKNLAEAHLLLKEYDNALNYLEESKALDPNFSETEKCFARCYEAQGETESAVLHWRRYLALVPETDTMEILSAQHHLDSLRAVDPL